MKRFWNTDDPFANGGSIKYNQKHQGVFMYHPINSVEGLASWGVLKYHDIEIGGYKTIINGVETWYEKRYEAEHVFTSFLRQLLTEMEQQQRQEQIDKQNNPFL